MGESRYRYPFPRIFYKTKGLEDLTRRAFDTIARAIEQLHVALLAVEIIDQPPSTLTVTTGTLDAGTVADLAETGGTSVQVSEVTGTPGFDVELAFAGLTYIEGVSVKLYYTGAANHAPRLELYNYTSTAWDTLASLPDESSSLWHWHTALVRDTDYISSGAARLRLYHYSAGAAAHDLFINFVSLKGY